MKKTVCILLSVLMLLAALPLAGHAAEIVASGACGAEGDGNNLTWTLDDEGTLTVSGTGKMEEYNPWGNPAPWGTSVKKAVLQSGVTSIGDYAFAGCISLTAVTIPDSVTGIREFAFRGCTGLTSVTIPDSVTSIGRNVFSGCTGLAAVTIPDSVTVIGYAAFAGCTGIETMTVTTGNPVYCSQNNCTINKDTKTLIAGCKNSVIPTDGCVTSIGYAAFAGCTGLTSVTIPDSVTSIGQGAFSGCTGLTSVTIGNGVTSIEWETFFGCTGLTALTIGNSVTNIGGYAFSGCTGLAAVTIPDSVTSIEGDAFEGCTGLTAVTIPDSVTSIERYAFSGCISLTAVTIPASVTGIGECAFRGCTGMTAVTVPDSVTSIELGAFYGCTGLTSVTIPASVTSIGQEAFYGCTGLTSVTIPDSVTSIRWGAFSGCTGLTSVTIPDSVTSIGREAIPAHTVICGYVGSYAQQWAAENNRAFVPIGDAAVTLNAPVAVNDPFADVCGFANPDATVRLSVNGVEVSKAVASANGRWHTRIPLTGAKDGDSFTVKAAVTLDGKTAEKTATVTYKIDAILFQEFTMLHNSYTVNCKAENRGVSVPNVTYVPGKPLAFKIKVSNSDRVDKLYVVSTKDGDSKQMALTYNEATGFWFVNGFFDETNKNYVPGVFTVTGVDKDGKEFDAGVTIKINFLVDPSGYAYEGVLSNKLEGVTAAVYYKDKDGHELLWNAETADQLNPITTLADGAFAWVVPEGEWQVRLTKDGYEEARSEWLPVPPIQENVYIPMMSTAAPEVAFCSVYADRAEITFSQYMNIDTVNEGSLKFDGYTGTAAPLDKTETSPGSGVFYAKSFSFTPEKSFSGEVSVSIAYVLNYAGREMAAPFTAAVTVAAEPKNLTARDVTVKYGETAAITVSAENAAGKTVSVACDSANVTLSAKTLTLDETGKATLTVTGNMPGTADLTFALDGTTLAAAASVAVAIPESPAKPAYALGDVDGNGKVESSDARLALRAAVHLSNEPTDVKEGSAGYTAADYDKNGKVESSDARCILRVSVKLDPFG